MTSSVVIVVGIDDGGGHPRICEKLEFGENGHIEEYEYIYTVETAYKVYICPRGNLLYIRIYLITDLKLL